MTNLENNWDSTNEIDRKMIDVKNFANILFKIILYEYKYKITNYEKLGKE